MRDTAFDGREKGDEVGERIVQYERDRQDEGAGWGTLRSVNKKDFIWRKEGK
jgi:hypothetical protein